jgi:hypothetical protein
MKSRKIQAYPAAPDKPRDIVVVEDETSDAASEYGRCDIIHDLYSKTDS